MDVMIFHVWCNKKEDLTLHKYFHRDNVSHCFWKDILQFNFHLHCIDANSEISDAKLSKPVHMERYHSMKPAL